MTDPMNREDSRRRRLDEVIGAFLMALDEGQDPDPRDWLARYPELGPELAHFFADQALVDCLIEPLRVASKPDDAREQATEKTVPQGDAACRTAPIETRGTDRGIAAVPPTTLPEEAPGAVDPRLTGVEVVTVFEDGGSHRLPRGSRIRYFGDYELERVLGEGGMGLVYKARQLSLNRPVALKMIKAARFASADDLRRFQNEAEAVARLDHPNIVPIFEVGQLDDQHYFGMKLIAGESLDKRLKAFADDPRRAARLMATTAGAIHHAHQRGILHRDLKPANILLDAEGQPHVTDFGLAKRVEGDSELTQTGAILGTPAYMAPEQTSAKKGAITTATDVYGLGAILYALLTGRGPFGGTTVLETLDQVRTHPPEPPRTLNPRVPRDLEVICLKCLDKDPRRRYAGADALADDLHHWLAGEPIAARPVGAAARVGMWCRRNPALAGAAGLLMTALVAVALLSLLSADRQARLAATETLRANEQARYAQDEARAAARLKASLVESNRRLAILNFERGQFAFNRGEIGPGLLWMVETARAATEAGDPDWKHLALASLSSWRSSYPNLRMVLAHGSNLTGLITVFKSGILYMYRDRGTEATFSPDGKIILTVEGSKARLWDTSSGQPIGEPLLHVGSIAAAAFSPDSKSVVTGAIDHYARLWDTGTGRLIGKTLQLKSNVHAVAFSPDSKTVLTGSGYSTGKASLWDATSGLPIGKPFEHRGAVLAVAFSPNGKTILIGGEDKTARLWDTATGLPFGDELKHDEEVRRVKFSPDGKTILIGSRDVLRLWNAETTRPIGQPVRHPGLYVDGVTFSQDSRFLLTASLDKAVRLWDVRTGEELGGPVHLEHQGSVRAVAFSPDARLIITGNDDKTARLWDAVTGRPLGQTMEHQAAIVAVAFSPDGKTILTGSEDTRVYLWNLEIGQPIGTPPEPRHRGSPEVAAPGAPIVAESSGKTVHLRNATTRQAIGKPLQDQAEVTAVVASPDGKTVLTGNRDRMARLWDVATGRPIGRPMPHADPVAFGPEGKTVLIAFYGDSRSWHVPEAVPDDLPLLTAWVQTLTGLELDDQGAVRALDGTEWRHRHELLNRLGGPPAMVPTRMLDPILFGVGPMARAQVWIERKCWPEAEVAYNEVLIARPSHAGVLAGRGLFYDSRGDTEKAVVDFARALALGDHRSVDRIVEDDALFVRVMAQLNRTAPVPDVAAAEIPLRIGRARRFHQRQEGSSLAANEYRIALDRGWLPSVMQDDYFTPVSAFLGVGDLTSYRIFCNRLLSSIPRIPDSNWGNNINPAWICVRCPDAVADMSMPIRLAEAALSTLDAEEKISEAAIKALGAEEAEALKSRRKLDRKESRAYVLHILGGALFRAGRFEEAIRRLEEAFRLGRHESIPEDLPSLAMFRAMAHHRLGHNEEAHRWLARSQDYHGKLGVEDLQLRSEAEAMILYDPVFPEDPFAH
jgi:eukaryotic-like serine/threonine-protein kinase